MRWTKSQRELIEVSQEPIKKISLDIVQVHEDFSGISTALKFIRRQAWLDTDAPRNLTFTGRPWDFIMQLVRAAGPKSYGNGYYDTLHRALMALTGNERKSLCLWWDDVRLVETHKREELIVLLEHAATHEGVPLRVVMLLGKSKVYNFETRRKDKKFVHSERLALRARKFDYSREGLDELRKLNGEDVVFSLTGEGPENIRKVG